MKGLSVIIVYLNIKYWEIIKFQRDQFPWEQNFVDLIV